MVQKPVRLQRHERGNPDPACRLPHQIHQRPVVFQKLLRRNLRQMRLLRMVGNRLPVKIAVVAAEGKQHLRILAQFQLFFRDRKPRVGACAHFGKVQNLDALLRQCVKIVRPAQMVPPVLKHHALCNRVPENNQPFCLCHGTYPPIDSA